MTRTVLHIDRLVLEGIERADAAGIAAGLQAELQVLLTADGAAAALAAHDASYVVQAGTARVPQGGDAASVGRAVAGRIVRPARRT